MKNKSEFIKKIQNGYSCKNLSLTGFDLSHSNLCGADFRGADLSNANFSYCNLSGAKFQNSNLRNANFSHAIIAGATMVIARISGIPIGNVNHTYFRSAALAGADFSLSKLEKADFVDSELQNCIFEGAFIRECEFGRTRLGKTNFTNCEIQNCDMSNISAHMLSASKCSFLNCTFPSADLTETDFINCEFNNCQLSSAMLVDSKFRHVRLTECDFTGIYGIRMEMVCNHLMGVVFNKATLEHSHWEDCNIYQSTFKEAVLSGATIRGTSGSSDFRGCIGSIRNDGE